MLKISDLRRYFTQFLTKLDHFRSFLSKKSDFEPKFDKFGPSEKNIESHMATVSISNVNNYRYMARSSIGYTVKIASFHTVRMIIERAIISRNETFGGLERGRLGIVI